MLQWIWLIGSKIADKPDLFLIPLSTLIVVFVSFLIICSNSSSQNIQQSLRKWRNIFESLKLVCDACALSEYLIEIKSTINPCLQDSSNKIDGADCAPLECNATINFFGTHQMDTIISWSMGLACVAVIIAGTPLMSKSKRLRALILELSLTQSRKRLLEVALLAIIVTGCRILNVFCWIWVGLLLLNWICGTFVIAVVVARNWVIVAVIVAAVAAT